MGNPTMAILCPHCHCWQRAPISVAEGTDPWTCEQCGKTIELPRRDLRAPAERPQSEKPNG
jgi:hypothetical protein